MQSLSLRSCSCFTLSVITKVRDSHAAIFQNFIFKKDRLPIVKSSFDIILPFHRIDSYFVQAIQSLADTRGVDINVILVDDRVDKSEKIYPYLIPLKKFQVESTDGGSGYGAALKVGSKQISSKYVALMNSDDLIDPLRFQKQRIALETSDICFTRVKRIGPDNRNRKSLLGEISSSFFDPIYLLFGSYGANASWAMHAEWWKQNAFFDLQECLDWRIALNSFSTSKIKFLPEDLYYYRKHPNQITAQKNLSVDRFHSLYSLWEKFASDLPIADCSQNIFYSFGIPWSNHGELDIDNFLKFSVAVEQYLNASHPEVKSDIVRFIKRRYLFSLRKNGRITNKLKLSLLAGEQIPLLLYELFVEGCLNHISN